MKSKYDKEKNLQKFSNVRSKEGSVRDQLLPQNSTSKSENIHKIQMGIGKNHHMSNNLPEISIKSLWVSSEMKKNGKNFVCKLCGKGFKSARAVCGHLRCHSKRNSEAEFENCAVNGLLEQELMKQPETPRKKRSGRRYTDKSNCSTLNSWCNLYSSYSSVTDDEELLEVAASLLMLSKGGFGCGCYPVSEKDDDSVKMEPRLPINSVRHDDNDHDHVAEYAEDVGAADQTPDRCNSTTSETAMYTSSSEKCQKHICSICSQSFPSYQSLGGHLLHCRRLCRVEIQAPMTADISTESTHDEKDDVEEGMNKDTDKKKGWKKHKCPVCCKGFHSGQALGGHMRAHYQSKETENVACDNENVADIKEERKEENDSFDDKILAAVIDQRKQENDACSNKIQQPLKERQMVIMPQSNIPVMV